MSARWYRGGLRGRLIALIVLGLTPLLLLQVYDIVNVRRLETEIAREDAMSLTRVAATTQGSFIEESRQLLGVLAELAEARGDDEERCTELLDRLIRQYPVYMNFGVAETDGTVFASARRFPAGLSLEEREFFKRAMSARAFAVGVYESDPITRRRTVDFAYPVMGEDHEIERVVFATLDPTWLNILASRIELPKGATLTIIDRTGMILARQPDPEMWVGRAPKGEPLIQQALLLESGVAGLRGLDGVERMHAFTPIGDERDPVAYLTIGIPQQIALAHVEQRNRLNLAVLGLVSTLAVGVSWVGADVFVLRPTHRLVNATQRLAAGEPGVRTNVPHDRDEIGRLAAAFDEMAEALEHREARLRDSELKHRTLVEQIPAVVYVRSLDSSAAPVYISPRLLEMLGYAPSDWMADAGAWRAAVHEDDAGTWQPVAPDTIGWESSATEYRMLRADGQEMWVRDEQVLIKDGFGSVVGVQGVLLDITGRRRAEEELERSNIELERRVEERTAELARSNAELEQFAYVASHDLQEPLRMVTSYLQLIERRYGARLDGEAHEFFGFAADGARRMSSLINDLLQLSRVGTRGKPFKRLDLDEALGHALDNLQAAIADHEACVTRDDMPEIVGDVGQLTQLFQNLVGNAIKFHGDATPKVHVSAERNGRGWVFGVADNGIGIAPEHRDRIFVIFQRLHTRDKYPGTGIGLSVCKKIVERHGGRIWVESESGAGTTFKFMLPDREEDADDSEG